MAEDKNTSQVNMKIPGMKGGPRNRGAAVEKACQLQPCCGDRYHCIYYLRCAFTYCI